MKVLIISGFLGAGKTTFIKELIRRTNKRLVILENEYGSADVDPQVLEAEDKADVWDLTEGCICCTKRADLTASIITIESTLDPDVLVVEPSGIGALSNVIRNLKKIEYERIRLLKPLTVVDAEHFVQNCIEFPDIYQDQIRACGTVMISKPEKPDPALLKQVEAAVNDLNPEASVLPAHYTQMPQEWWDSVLTSAYDGGSLEEVDESALDLETYTVKDCHVDSPASLLWMLERAVRGYYGEIRRAKGLLPAGKDWVRFDIADGIISITGFEGSISPHAAQCVWIGRALDRLLLRSMLTDMQSIFNQRTSKRGLRPPSDEAGGIKKILPGCVSRPDSI